MAAPGENLKIDGGRLWDDLMEMASVGLESGWEQACRFLSRD